MYIESDDTLLFLGDSITDAGRNYTDPMDLGRGYVSQIDAQVKSWVASPDLQIVNRGVSGNRIYDLEQRIDVDGIRVDASIVTILIGINDTWRRYDSAKESPLDEFHECYFRILSTLKDRLDCYLILMEPFLLHVTEDQRAWREDLDPKIHVVRDLAVEFGADLIPLDGLFAAAAARAPADYWAADGVHPTAAGHAIIANAWMDLVQ